MIDGIIQHLGESVVHYRLNIVRKPGQRKRDRNVFVDDGLIEAGKDKVALKAPFRGRSCTREIPCRSGRTRLEYLPVSEQPAQMQADRLSRNAQVICQLPARCGSFLRNVVANGVTGRLISRHVADYKIIRKVIK